MDHNWFQDHLDTVVRSRPWSSTETIKVSKFNITTLYKPIVQIVFLKFQDNWTLVFLLGINILVAPSKDFFTILLINYLVLQRVGHIFFFFLCLCIKGNMAIYSKTLLCCCCFIISFLFTPKHFLVGQTIRTFKNKVERKY